MADWSLLRNPLSVGLEEELRVVLEELDLAPRPAPRPDPRRPAPPRPAPPRPAPPRRGGAPWRPAPRRP